MLNGCKKNPQICGGIFDIDVKKKRLQELEQASQNPAIWEKPAEMQKIQRERALLEKSVEGWETLTGQIADAQVLLEMAVEESDESTFEELKSELQKMSKVVDELEMKSLLSEELDGNSCYLSINSGAGGTEACDWAGMLLRMYDRYANDHDYKCEVVAMTEGEEAGIKSATLLIEGPYAYGNLKTENGVHRLVRISPFDSNARRHTSFASVYCWPEVDDDIEIEIKDEDIRIDTYRAGGAGGQHINRTDSAVRITHHPSGIVVQCQNQRSQHANKDKAFKMLKAALYELEIEKRNAEKEQAAGEKKANEWGSQIRSYVLHPYQLVKDHRTDFESGNPQSVLDGELDSFIESYLKQQALNKKST
ncbi:MAG: peptide chain release factor 2 [Bdellovibrionales bacterium]|nr:peptide chain release factor 2 [Bdellovibrionales bacterium]